MRCPSCGANVTDDLRECDFCGSSLSTTAEAASEQIQTPHMSAEPQIDLEEANPKQGLSFTDAIATCMTKYATFSGRASRPEFWWFYLFTIVISWAAGLLDGTKSLGFVSWLVNLTLFLPSIAAITRRLHDTNRSGWWQLIGITIIGLIPLVYWLCLPGDRDRNQYGKPVI